MSEVALTWIDESDKKPETKKKWKFHVVMAKATESSMQDKIYEMLKHTFPNKEDHPNIKDCLNRTNAHLVYVKCITLFQKHEEIISQVAAAMIYHLKDDVAVVSWLGHYMFMDSKLMLHLSMPSKHKVSNLSRVGFAKIFCQLVGVHGCALFKKYSQPK